MNKLALALGLAVAAGPLLAEGLAFEPVEPEGLDAAALEIVEQLQARLPAQMPLFEQQGIGYYGALAAPKETEISPETFQNWVGISAVVENEEMAREAAVTDCATKNGTECTVIGLLVPAEE